MNFSQNLGLSLHWEPEIRAQQYAFAAEHQLGLEIIGFTWHEVWNDPSLREQTLAQYTQELHLNPCLWSLHGPFLDILPHSKDKAIRNIAEERIVESIEIALQLGITKLIFHTGINAAATAPAHDDVLQRQADFWSSILDRYHTITICLENTHEPEPAIFKRLFGLVGHERVGMCLDIGHANLHSPVPLCQWIEELSSSILHLHLHDGDGAHESHLEIGQGQIDWPEFLSLSELYLRHAKYILEVHPFERQKNSFDALISYSRSNLNY
jgi:sugar phosphate isomerase/epimerase